MRQACSALKPVIENGTRCANGFLDNVACQHPGLGGARVLPPCLREDQSPLPNRIDWDFLSKTDYDGPKALQERRSNR